MALTAMMMEMLSLPMLLLQQLLVLLSPLAVDTDWPALMMLFQIFAAAVADVEIVD